MGAGTARAILEGVRGRHFSGGRTLVGEVPVDGPPPRSLIRRVARRLAGEDKDTVDTEARASVDALNGRAEYAEAWLRQADERFIGLAVHSTERTDALTARVTDAEQRLADLEIEAARLGDALRHVGEGAPPVGDTDAEVAYWRTRLRAGDDGAPAPHRNGAVTRVATDVGALLLPAHDEVMLTFLREHGEWERQEADQLRALLGPGMTFVDVGAHVGYMSLLAASAVGPTGRGYAFEPEPGNFRLLTANLANHGVEHVHAVPAAAWHESGRLSLSVCADNTGDHRAYPLPGRPAVDVLAVAIDDVLPEDTKVDVVKVDAQATDDLAIRGMERTLARSRPVMLVEFWPEGIRQRGAVPMDVLEYYRGLHYDIAAIGDAPVAAGAPLDAVMEAAESSPSGFCSLLLTPSP